MRLIRLFKRDLAKESAGWVKDNLISQDQAEAICERYGIDYHNAANHSYGYAVLVALGYLFIGLAIITLLSANWEDIPRAVRMLGLLILTAGTNLFALKQYQNGKESMSIGLFFLGALFYGASIMLIAQIYHIDEHYPNGIFWWAMGILPLALLLQSSLLMMLMTALSYTWFLVEVDLNYYPILFPVFLFALGWHVFRFKQSYILFLALMVGIGFWIEYSLVWYLSDFYRYRFDESHFIYAVGIVISFYGFSKWLLSRQDQVLADYGIILNLWVLRFAIICLLFFSFEWLWEGLIDESWEQPALTLGIAAIFCAIAFVLAFLGNKQIYSTLGFIITYLLSTTMVIWVENDFYAIYFQIATNMVLVIMGVWLIIRGIRDGLTHYFFLGVSTILLTGLLRYIDLVGDYIGAAILFIIFAVILLSAARFWKTHKQEKQIT